MMIMLKTNKVVTLSAESTIDDLPIVQMNATIDVNDGIKTSYSEFIVDQDSYREHRAEIRTDLEAFRTQMYDIEDSKMATTTVPTEA